MQLEAREVKHQQQALRLAFGNDLQELAHDFRLSLMQADLYGCPCRKPHGGREPRSPNDGKKQGHWPIAFPNRRVVPQTAAYVPARRRALQAPHYTPLGRDAATLRPRCPLFPRLCFHAAALFPLHLRSPIVLLRSAARPRKWVLLAAVLAMRRSLPHTYAACTEYAGGSRRALTRGKHVLVTLAAEIGIKSPRSFAFPWAARIINVAAAPLRPCASRCLYYM